MTLTVLAFTSLAGFAYPAKPTSSGAPDVSASPAPFGGAKERSLLARAPEPSSHVAMFETKRHGVRVWVSSAYQPPERCRGAQKAIGYYRRAYTASRTAMGLPGAPPRAWYPCDTARRRAAEWRDRAKAARTQLERWKREQWAAPPEPFLSIARCENRGSGLHGVNWDAYNSVYEGAYGFLHSTWDRYKPAGYPESASTATIAQQTTVARILVATFGGYSSWPACHIRLGLPG